MATLIWFAVIAIVAYAIWRMVNSHARTITTAGTIRGGGTFDCEVVGESKYQQHLERIAGGRNDQSARIRKEAILVLEDENPHDSSAVCVFVDGLRVGYLSRETARSYRARLKQQGLPLAHYRCEALVVGGWDRGRQDRGHFGVRLDIPVEQ